MEPTTTPTQEGPMANPATPTQPAAPARCEHRSDLGLGCARSSGHAGAHWLTASPEAARADLVRQGILGR
jgi:hypothetical protein